MMENQSAPTPDAPLFAPREEGQREAEFSQEDMWRLAYGLHNELVQAYIRRRIAQASEPPAEKTRREADVHAAGVIAGMDAYRTTRGRAQERVDRLVSKARLQYGSLHLAKNPMLAAKVHEDAVAQARAEGYRTSALESSPGMIMPQPGPKARQAHAELVAALKAHDRFMYSAKARAEAPSGPPDRWAELKEAIGHDLPLPTWVAEAAEEALAKPEAPEAEPVAPPVEAVVPEPVVTPPVGRRARAGQMWRRVKHELFLAPLTIQQKIVGVARRVAGYFGDKEKGDRRKGAAFAIGALGLAAAATVLYLESRGHRAVCLPPKHSPPPTGHEPVPLPGTSPAPPMAATPVRLTLGTHEDSIWREVVGYAASRGVRLDESQKNQLVDRVLQANSQTRESARHLPVGYGFALDPRILGGIVEQGK